MGFGLPTWREGRWENQKQNSSLTQGFCDLPEIPSTEVGGSLKADLKHSGLFSNVVYQSDGVCHSLSTLIN